MPQLDKVTFFTQISWLLVVFFSLYVILLKFILPKLALILKLRQRRIAKFLSDSNSFKKEAETRAQIHFDILFRSVFVSNRILDETLKNFYLYEELNKIYMLQGSSIVTFNELFFNELVSIQLKRTLLNRGDSIL
uniref:ATP synthase F0 subunit 8 n=1 Tax=Phalansterium sp. PJK-2012 TaxID=1267188 RepID=T1QE04_9EUKA|nr:ATP synthase F0 subunit 8 [Phalansterium sp. PJK-2012]